MDEQKIIQELKEAGCYEDGMTVAQMTELLDIIRMSLKHDKQNRISNKSPEPQVQGHQLAYSQAAANSNALSGSLRRSMTLDPPSNLCNNLTSQEKVRREGSPEESLFSPPTRNSYAKDCKETFTNANKNFWSNNENNPEGMNENKRGNSRQKSQQKSEEKVVQKCKINPFDFAYIENDVPLISRFRSASDQECESARNAANVEKAIAQLSLHLQEVSDLRRSQHWSTLQRNISWGIGIKVGSANGSLDKKVGADEETERADLPDETNQNVSIETQSGRTRRACVNKLGVHAYDENDLISSDEDFTTNQKRKKPTKLEELQESPVSQKESNLNVSGETSRRRKATARSDDYQWEKLMLDTDEEEEEKNFAKKKKARISNAKKPTASRLTKGKSVEPASTDENKNNSIEKEDALSISIDDSDEVTICDEPGTSQSMYTLKKSPSADSTSLPSSSSSAIYPRRIVPPIPKSASNYPRRIVPPNPRGKYFGIRTRHPLHPQATRPNKQDKQYNEDDAEVAPTVSRGKCNAGLQEAEIVEALENDNEETEKPSSSYQSSFLPLRTSSRMKLQGERLRYESKKDEEAALAHEREHKLREEQIAREKQERVKERVREEAEKAKAEQIKEKRKLALEASWSALTRAKEKQRLPERTELNPEGPRRNKDVESIEVMPENHFGMDETEVEVVRSTHMQRRNDSQSEQVPCPICGKNFTVGKEIEDHAAACEEFESAGSAGGSRSSSPAIPTASRITQQKDDSDLYICYACSKFKAKNGREFEDHVKSCIARQKECVSVAPGLVVQVPDSPIKGFRKLSSLADSEKEFLTQFAPRTRSKFNTGTKRKRL